ncbi:DUF2750 domain-containing protein [Cronobacter dublinensis]|uniref:DUF2750 domain-containing protein n=1 Tax=Cronobacter dublinensis TaxID=413497 RepID=UPI000517EA5D|nr:DUF2750 domain-containing protein [Cronobacter dublinensis]ALB65080.1 hypothetical protein AFK67_00635 [Cronobacter dublinensis subsp. dublinensis LMG 23823]MDI7272458.1 DUF2750 domain-containing protein [Cronobacter dublinensis]
MKLSEQEIKALLNKNAKERYVYFIKKVVDWECAWSLGDESGYATTEDNKAQTSLPLWPAKEYAQECAINEWKNLSVKKVHLNELLDELLPQLIDDEIDIVVFMAPNETCVPVLSAMNVLTDLLKEFEKYK